MATQPPRVIIVAGPPGSGKGTQCKRLVEDQGFVHISTGDVFRDAVEGGTALGTAAATHMQQGRFVPDDQVIAMVRQRLAQPDVAARGALLDGFPRTAGQARALLTHGIAVERFLLLTTTDSVCTDRILHRRVDRDTGEIFNLRDLPPSVDAGRLVRREVMVTEETIAARLRTYHSQLGLILPHFRGKIQVVQGCTC